MEELWLTCLFDYDKIKKALERMTGLSKSGADMLDRVFFRKLAFVLS